MFTQILDPTGNLFLTWLVALIPVVVLLVLLAVFRISAWISVLIGSIVTVFLALAVWKMPVDDNAFLDLRTAKGQTAWLHVSCTEWKNLFSFGLNPSADSLAMGTKETSGARQLRLNIQKPVLESSTAPSRWARLKDSMAKSRRVQMRP